MRKCWLEILASAGVLVISYGSLVPFDFSWKAQPPGHRSYLGLPIVDVNFPDVASNIAMYAPFGVLVCAFFSRRSWPLPWAIAATLVSAGMMGYCIEHVQKFLSSRTSSIADVICNVLGAGIGVAIFAPKSALARRCVRALRDELVDAPSALPAIAWGLGVKVMSLAPFDLTFDVSHLGRTIRTAHWMPFTKHADLVAGAVNASSATDTQLSFAAVNLWNLRLDYVSDVLVFAVFGILLAQHFRTVDRHRVTALLRSCAMTMTAAVFVTGASLFVMSVGFDATRFITRITGGVLGSLCYAYVPPADARLAGVVWSERVRVALAACIVYIIARELLPFEIDTAHAGAKFARFEWLPMHSYTLALLPDATADALQKASRFITLGAALAVLWRLQGRVISAPRRVAAGIAAGLVLSVFELMQCWLPGRIPAVTDCILAALTTTAGIVLGEALCAFHAALRADAVRQRRDRAILNVELPAPAVATTTDAPSPTPTTTRTRPS